MTTEVKTKIVWRNVAPSGWSDNFDGGSGNLDARTDWGINYALVYGIARSADVTISSDAAVRAGSNTGEYQYCLVTGYTPSSADYYVQCLCKVGAETGNRMIGPFIRGSVGTDNKGNGYLAYFDVEFDYAAIERYDNGTSTTISASVALTGGPYNWVTGVTVKLKVTGTTLYLYCNGNLERTVSSGVTITDAGYGGIASYLLAGKNETFDDFEIGY